MNYLKKNALLIIIMFALIFVSFQAGSMYKELTLLRDGSGILPALGLDDNVPGAQAFNVDDVVPITDRDNVMGNRDAKISLIVYSDYECLYCKTFHTTAERVVAEFDGEVKWAYRHFPIESIHPNAKGTAIAAECVRENGSNDLFWTFTREVFDGAPQDEASLISVAANLGVDITSCVVNEESVGKVEDDIASAFKAGITGTPGNILLNEDTGEAVLIPGALPQAQLTQAIENLMK